MRQLSNQGLRAFAKMGVSQNVTLWSPGTLAESFFGSRDCVPPAVIAED